ncbi:MAG: hypothetical protein ACKOKE_07190, partial [Actinomycetota bacterium]
HTAAEKLGQMHLELPLAAFQPGLCHPHLFEALVGMAADDYKKIVDVAAPDQAFMTETQIHTCCAWPVKGQAWTKGKSLFAADDDAVLRSRMLWCFWLYNASRAVPSVQLSKLHESVIFGRWTLKKCSNRMTACAKRIFGEHVMTPPLVS